MPEHFAHAHAGVGVIIGHQRTGALQLRNRLVFHNGVGQLAVQHHHKFRAFSFLAPDADGSAHHIQDVLGDGHAQAGSLDSADGCRLLSGKGFENMLLELLGHADAVVLYAKFKGGVSAEGAGLFQHPDADGSAYRGKFDGIAGNIQQHLIEAQFISNNILMQDILGVDEKILLLCRNIGLDDGSQVVKHIRQMHLFFLDFHPAALNTAHIQHIVDEAQQMVAGHGDFAQVILDCFHIIQMGSRQRRIADDGIHRRPDIMRHIVEKGRLRPVGVLSRGKGIHQCLPLCHLFLLFLIHIQKGKGNAGHFFVCSGKLDQYQLQPDISAVFAHVQEFTGVPLLIPKDLSYIALIGIPKHFIPIVRMGIFKNALFVYVEEAVGILVVMISDFLGNGPAGIVSDILFCVKIDVIQSGILAGEAFDFLHILFQQPSLLRFPAVELIQLCMIQDIGDGQQVAAYQVAVHHHMLLRQHGIAQSVFCPVAVENMVFAVFKALGQMIGIKKREIRRLQLLGQLVAPVLDHIPVFAVVRKPNCLVDAVLHIINDLVHGARHKIPGNIDIIVGACTGRKGMLHNSYFVPTGLQLLL